ncbi:MAG: hypothetical protein LBQ24_03905 [Candidatus Peribacteria bacterium]|nr:hypothetical protein [Candidatus Peribacteria bacterium]
MMKYFGEVKENIDEEVKKFLSLPISYNLLFPTSRLKNSKIKKKVFVISENEEKQNSPQSPFIKGENLYSPLIKGGREIS